MKAKHIKVKVYWNLHKKCYSVQHKGRVIMHSHSFLFLSDVTLKVSKAGNARVRAEGKKNVHAFVCGTLVNGGVGIAGVETAITYNPYKYTSFVRKVDETPVHTAKCARLTIAKNADGSNRPVITVSEGTVVVDDLLEIVDELLASDAA